MIKTVSVLNLIVVLVCSVLSSRAAAVEIHELEVRHAKGEYVVSMQFDTDASAVALMRLLTDFEHLDRLNPRIISSELLPTNNPASARVRTHAKGCVLSICLSVVRVEDVSQGPGNVLYSKIVPNSGDIRSGETYCEFEERGTGTRVHYRSTLELDFFVPPFLGPLLISRGIKQELRRTVQNLEKLARQP